MSPVPARVENTLRPVFPYRRASVVVGAVGAFALRHGAVTLSLAAGNDLKITSAVLRHCSLAMTSGLCIAVFPEAAHVAAEAGAALVPRRSGRSATWPERRQQHSRA